jgi:hypothetical protein
MTAEWTPITFVATIPPIQSAIRTGGDGMRVQFDVPETDIGDALQLVLVRGKVLKITVEVVESDKKTGRQI